MLPKPYRLSKEKDYHRVYKKGHFFNLGFLSIKVLKTSRPKIRFGIVVGTKISKKATVRNKIKRRLREVVRLKLKVIKPGFDVIIMVKPEILEKNFQEIDQTMIKILKKANLFETL